MLFDCLFEGDGTDGISLVIALTCSREQERKFQTVLFYLNLKISDNIPANFVNCQQHLVAILLT
jgi:hypothetical protein